MRPQVNLSSPLERTSSFHYYPRRGHAYNYHDMDSSRSESWEQMAHTLAWVREEQIEEMLRKNEETVQRIMARQKRQMEKEMAKAFGDVIIVLEKEMDAERWLARARQEEARRTEMRARREAEKQRVLHDELRKLQRRRKDEEDKRARAKAAKDAWVRYDSRWSEILGNPKESLTFANIPWPLVSQPRNVDSITTEDIREFLFSNEYSPNQSHKERIRAALRLWHPDRFRRVLSRVEGDRAMVEQGVGVVARALNGLMEKTNA